MLKHTVLALQIINNEKVIVTSPVADITVFLAGAGVRPATVSSPRRVIARAHAGGRGDGPVRIYPAHLAESVYRLSGGDRLHDSPGAFPDDSGDPGFLLVAGGGGGPDDAGGKRPVGLSAGKIQ